MEDNYYNIDDGQIDYSNKNNDYRLLNIYQQSLEKITEENENIQSSCKQSDYYKSNLSVQQKQKSVVNERQSQEFRSSIENKDSIHIHKISGINNQICEQEEFQYNQDFFQNSQNQKIFNLDQNNISKDGLTMSGQMDISCSPIKQSSYEKQMFNLQLKFIDDISQENVVSNHKQNPINKFIWNQQTEMNKIKDDVSSEGTVDNSQNTEIHYNIYQYSSQQQNKNQNNIIENRKFIFDGQNEVSDKVVDVDSVVDIQSQSQNGRKQSDKQYLHKIQEINEQIRQNVNKRSHNSSTQQLVQKKKEESHNKPNRVVQKQQQNTKINKNLKQKVLKQQKEVKEVKQLKIKMKDFKDGKEKSNSKPKQSNVNIQKVVQQQIVKKQQFSNLSVMNNHSQSNSNEKQRKTSYNDFQQTQNSYQRLNRQKNVCQQSLKENVIEQLFSKRLQVLQDIKNIDQMLQKEKGVGKKQNYQKSQKQNVNVIPNNSQGQKQFHLKRETNESVFSRHNSSLYSQIHRSRDQLKSNISQTNNKKQKNQKQIQSNTSIKKKQNKKQEVKQNQKLSKEISELMQIFQEIKQVRV